MQLVTHTLHTHTQAQTQLPRVPGRGQVNGEPPSEPPAPAGRAAMLKQQPTPLRAPAMSQPITGRAGEHTAGQTSPATKLDPSFNKKGSSGERYQMCAL